MHTRFPQWLLAVVTAMALILGMSAAASADNVVNNGDDSIDSPQESYSVTAGSTVSIGLFLEATSIGNDNSGCNVGVAGDGKTVTVALAPNITGVSATSVVIDICDDPLTTGRDGLQSSILTASAITAPGTYAIPSSRFTVTNNGGATGSYSATTGAFQLTVDPVPDSSAPVITKVVTGTAGSNGWYTSNVTVTWTVTDAQSAVFVDSGCGVQTFATETASTSSSCTAHSLGGSDSQSVSLKIDMTAPDATLAPSGAPGANGWFVDDVTVATNGSDNISGPANCTADQVISTETASQVVNGSCTNQAGLTGNAVPITVKLDKTGPTAVLTPSGILGSNGWYSSDVIVSAAGADGISGPVTCTADVILSDDTAGSTVNGSCTNQAGLSTDASAVTVKLDQTDPSAHVALAGTLGTNGWYVSNVVATTLGSDTVSEPVECTDPHTYATDGTGFVAEGDCTNNAGRVQHAVSDEFKIDKTAPTGVALEILSGTEGANGWYTSDVVVKTVGTDATSGVACTANQTLVTEGTFEINGECTNGAGLSTDAAPITVKIDKSAPTATLNLAGTVGGNGWYTSNVTATTIGEDDVSGITCTPVQSFTTNTTGTEVSGSCTNGAGLTANAASATVKIDKDAPTAISFVGGIAANGSYPWGFVPAIPTCTATDVVSGLDACSVSGYSTATGPHTLTATAVDNAGNESTATLNYTVTAWTVNGFTAPVDMDTTSTKVFNTVKNGSTVPLKFEVFAGATELTDTTYVVQPITTAKVSCATGAFEAPVETVATGATSLRYDTTAGQFVFNWKTPAAKNSCYDVTVALADGSQIQAHFSLR